MLDIAVILFPLQYAQTSTAKSLLATLECSLRERTSPATVE